MAVLGVEGRTPDDDGDLLRRARAGESSAIEALYTAHLGPAQRLATILAGPGGADDLVADSFAKVLAQIAAGRGPASNFRSYLLAVIRNRYRDVLRLTGREAPASDQPWLLDAEESPVEEYVDDLDDDAAVAALSSLPSSWQQVLWHLEVEGRRVPEVADLLQMTPAAVSSLSYRAREGLKTAYLNQRIDTAAADRRCRWVRQRLGPYVRDALSPRAAGKLEEHLPGCVDCATALADLEHVNRKLAALLVPILLVGGMRALDTVSGTVSGAVSGTVSGAAGGTGGEVSGGGPSGSTRLGRELASRAAGASPAQAAAAAAGSGGATGASLAARLRHLLSGGPAGRSALATSAVAVTAVGIVVAAVLVAAARWLGDEPATEPPGAASTVADTGPGAPSASDPASPTAPTDDRSRPAPPPTRPSIAPVTATTAPPSEAPSTEVPPSTEIPPSTEDPSQEPSSPITVVPARPTSSPIVGCGDYGSLTMPDTEGVTYTLVRGDGRQGGWLVRAAARDGYVIRDGAPTRFSGDLGTHYSCPTLGAIAVQPQPGSEWDVSVPVSAAGAATYWARSIVRFDIDVIVPAGGETADGWTCWGPATPSTPPLRIGADVEYLLPAGLEVTCLFEYAGEPPPALSLRTVTVADRPVGTVALYSEGRFRDNATF